VKKGVSALWFIRSNRTFCMMQEARFQGFHKPMQNPANTGPAVMVTWGIDLSSNSGLEEQTEG
jgi:hypothetical protein